jgi:hypothetical protein
MLAPNIIQEAKPKKPDTFSHGHGKEKIAG